MNFLSKHWLRPGSTWQFAKGKCKESVANLVKSHNTLRNSNLLYSKSIYMHHHRRCTNVVSIQIQDSKKTITRLLAVLISTPGFLVSTSTSMTSTESRRINFNSNIGHKVTSFVWQESLFNKDLTQNVEPCVAFPATRAEYMLRADTSHGESWAKET
jgi:hypothetical protein